MAANNIYLQVTFNSQAAQANVNALNQAIGQTGPTAQKSSQQATGALQQVNVAVSQTARSFGELTAALAGLGIARLVNNIVQVGSDLSRAQIMMEAFTGSAADAAKVFEEIRAVAAQSPFRFKDLEDTGRRLAGFGMAAKDIAPTLKVITDQVAAMGGSIENVNSIVGIFGRVMSKDFVGAMDLMRLLPQQGVKVMDALRKAIGTDQGGGMASVQEVQKAIKAGVLEPMEALRVVTQAMAQGTGGAGAKIKDFAFFMKTLGDAFDYASKKLLGPDGFGPALEHLGQEIQMALTPLAALLEYILKLPEPTKELIVNVTAGTAAVVAFAGAWSLFTSIAGPAITAIYAIGEALSKALLAVLANPELLVGIGAVAAALYGLYKLNPEKSKEMLTGAQKWITDLWGSLKQTVTGLAKESGLFDTIFKVPDLSKGTGKITQETEENLKKVQTTVEEWGDSAGKSLLGALSSPVEAVIIKYSEMLKKLNEEIKDLAITPEHADALRQQLATAKGMEMEGKLFEKQKQNITERGKFETEKIKGSYEAQIAYIEAMDEQGLRKKVAAIDQITALRVESSKKVAEQEDHDLQQIFEQQKLELTNNADYLASKGIDVQQVIADREAEMAAKKLVIDQKAIDDQQKYRLEGWKKANDVIIEDQKRVFEAFKGEFDEIFDALTSKTKNIGQALGDVFKKLALGELKNMFSSQLAGFSTELAGYGRPEPGITRGGGILGQLLGRGMPTRPPGAPPGLYTPTESGGNLITSSANRLDIASDKSLVASDTFARAVAVFAEATVSSKGYAARTADSADDISDAFTRASQTTGVGESLLRAVAQTESGMRPGAVSPKGAVGLMQLMPATMKDFGVTQGFDVGQNVMGGAKDLKKLLTRYGGDIPSALAAYNMGPAAFDRAMAKGAALPQETQNYVQHVQGLMAQTAISEGVPLAQATRPFQLPPGFSMEGGQLAYETPSGGAQPTLGEPPIVSPAAVAEQPGLLARAGGGLGGAELKQLEGMLGIKGVSGIGAGLAGIGGLFGIGGARFGAAPGGESMQRAADLAGTTATQISGTTLKSILTSRGTLGLLGAAGTFGGMALLSKGLQQHYAPAAVAGGGLAGAGMMLSPDMLAKYGASGVGAGAAAGAGLGLFASGFQRGGAGGLAMDVGGGALAGAGIGFMAGGPLGAAIGAGIGAVAGAITGVVRLFVKTEQERIRATIKQVYGIDISNRSILTQIQQIVDQKYGGSVSIGVRSQDVQDIIRLYALSTGQAANLPRPMYAATIAQSTQGLQTQAVYQGGVKVANPYTGPTTYQYQSAVVGAQGLMPGTSLGVPGASGLINEGWQQLTLATIRANPAAVANANAAAATAGDSRLSTTAAMQEPLTALS